MLYYYCNNYNGNNNINKVKIAIDMTIIIRIMIMTFYQHKEEKYVTLLNTQKRLICRDTDMIRCRQGSLENIQIFKVSKLLVDISLPIDYMYDE